MAWSPSGVGQVWARWPAGVGLVSAVVGLVSKFCLLEFADVAVAVVLGWGFECRGCLCCRGAVAGWLVG